MRTLACADRHGRPERITRVRALVAEHARDFVILPGDLTHAGSGQQALELLTLSVPVLAVAGNMDGPAEAARIRTGGSLHGVTRSRSGESHSVGRQSRIPATSSWCTSRLTECSTSCPPESISGHGMCST